MGSPFCIVNIVAKSQNILPEFIGKLKGCLNSNPFVFPLQIDRLMENLRIFIQITNEAHNSIGLMEF